MWLDTLIELKKTSKMTLKQISDKSGVPVGTLNKLFAGQTKDPKLETIRAVVYSLGYTLDDLMPAKKSPDTTEAIPGDGPISLEESNKLLVALGYITEGEDLYDADLAFLTHIIALLDAWFDQRHQGTVDQAGMPA